ncbi:MAG: hypothetical protein EU536_02040 [Promethearchaeota archaeon]|nr:MAG: hypothetical protein EU536_02040 [Candidatus Lokiarchaeota archaeon]
MDKSEPSEDRKRLDKILSKRLAYNRVEIAFNNKSIIIDYLTPKKAVEQAIQYLFKVIEYFNFTGSILNEGSDKYRTIDIKRYFAHPMLRSELWNIEKNLLLYGGTVKYGGRVYIEIGPSPLYKGRLLIKTKTAWKKDDTNNAIESLSESFKFKTPPKVTKKLADLIDEKITIEKNIKEKQREVFLKQRKEELERKIEEEKRKLARLEEEERGKEEQEKFRKMNQWRMNNKLFPIADLASINWDKRWMDDFDIISDRIINVKIENLEDEDYLRIYCDQVIDFILALDVYSIKSDPEIKSMMVRRIHESKKLAIMKLMEPEILDEPGGSIEASLQQLIEQLPRTPTSTIAKPKPVPVKAEKEDKEREQKEISLFD